VPDATQWDQGEIVGDCSHPIFKYLEKRTLPANLLDIAE
jgi:hypothetical protein